MTGPISELRASELVLSYGERTIIDGLDLTVLPGAFTAILGPNACGKSTLLRSLGRVMAPTKGAVLLDGADINALRTKEVARKVALLPQSASAPSGITVGDLVARGRYPHQSFFRQWSDADADAIGAAMAATGISDLADRVVDELSGGQRQRVWIATVLAQESGILLLDEPTTFLDIAHQIDVLELCLQLNRDRGVTIVAVLHDLNQAARYAERILLLRGGHTLAEGAPTEVLTEANVRDAYGLECRVVEDPISGTPLVLPLGGRAR